MGKKIIYVKCIDTLFGCFIQDFVHVYRLWQFSEACIIQYSSPSILRPPLQPEKYGLKLKVVLKWRGLYIWKYKNGFTDSRAGLKIERIIKWKGLKS